MLHKHFLLTISTASIHLLLICVAISPSLSFSNDSDGYPFTPNAFDVELAPPELPEQHVYSQNHEYTEFGRYRDIPFNTHVYAFLSNDARLSSIDVSVKMKSPYAESTFQPIFSITPPRDSYPYHRDPNFPAVGRLQFLSKRGDLNHRVFAAYAIEACQKNADDWIDAGRPAEEHFSQDHILPLDFKYQLQLNRYSSETYRPQRSQENSGTHIRTVRNVGRIICHSNADRSPRPPSNQYVVHQVKIDYLDVENTQDRCGVLRGRIEIKTNKPNWQIHFAVRSVIHTAPWTGSQHPLRGQEEVITDSNGVASGFFWQDINYNPNGYRGDVRGSLRVVGTNTTFESNPLEYEFNCNRARPDINEDEIKELGINPKLRVPSNQLPGNAPIVRPDAPDSRLQIDENVSKIKLKKPNMGIKQNMQNNRPALKPLKPNSSMTLQKNEPAIKLEQPDARLKLPESTKNAPVLEPKLEKEIKQDLKSKLRNIN